MKGMWMTRERIYTTYRLNNLSYTQDRTTVRGKELMNGGFYYGFYGFLLLFS